MKSICVFCGSSPGAKPEYGQAVQSLGRELARRRLTLVYGGGSVGLMGRMAQAALEAGGEVVGVTPKRMVEMEVVHQGLTRLHIVESMHERKALMAELSDAFIAAPGGFGTIEEFFEALTWTQLGFHRKPCGLLNVGGFYGKLLDFLDTLVSQRFVHEAHRAMILVEESPQRLLDRLAAFQLPRADKAAWALRMTREAESGME